MNHDFLVGFVGCMLWSRQRGGTTFSMSERFYQTPYWRDLRLFILARGARGGSGTMKQNRRDLLAGLGILLAIAISSTALLALTFHLLASP